MILAADSELCMALFVEKALFTREALFVGDTDDGVLPWPVVAVCCCDAFEICFD